MSESVICGYKTVIVASLVIVLLSFVPCTAFTATYYIDYVAGSDTSIGTSKAAPWKRSPGMSGFSGSYAHSTGDIFIFKGGVTWPNTCFPFSIAYSGTQSNPDQYTVDKTWYAGTAYTRPVFDGGGNVAPYTGVVSLDNRSWVKVDGFKVVNVGIRGRSSQGRAIEGSIGEGIEISNCEIIPYGNHAIVINYSPSSSAIINGVKIHGNKISFSANSIEIGIASGAGANDILNIQIYENEIFDISEQLIGGDHGDGIHIFSVDNVKQVKQLKIYGNKFYGDWGGSDTLTSNTGNIYIEDCADGALIYNNHHTFSNVTSDRPSYMISPGFIVIYGSNNIEIYNNSMSASRMASQTGSYGVMSGIRVYSATNVTVKNNAILDTRLGLMFENVANVVSDYNICRPRAGDGYFGSLNNSFKTLSQWKTLGFDANSLEADPGFADVVNPPIDLALRSTSPSIDKGQDLSARFAVDILNYSRPTGIRWDVGAYEFQSVGTLPPPVPPIPPSGLQVN